MAITSQSGIAEIRSFQKTHDHLTGHHTLEAENSEGLHYLAYLLELNQVLSGETQKCVDRLCQEVESMTQGKVQLRLKHQRERSYESISTIAASFPLQFKQYAYGTLCVSYHVNAPNEPAISLPIARLLAETCGWILYTLEQSAFVQGQCQRLNYQIHGELTKREKEVLALMFRGYGQQDIADTLSISPATVRKHRQHIYNQLGVHCERDALLAAYFSGMFSLIGDSSL